MILALLLFFTSLTGINTKPGTDLLASVAVEEIIVADSLEDRYVLIDKIFIVGNKLTKPPIILRELDILEGEIYYLKDLREVLKENENKIFNTQLFVTVDIQVLELSENKVDILIEVTERWYTFPIPIFSLADRNFNDWWENQDADLSRVNYGLRFYQHNVRGRNERLKAVAQFGYTKKFELSYAVPYINKAQKNGLILYAGYAENKNIAYRTLDHRLVFQDSEEVLRESIAGEATFTHRASFYNSHFFTLGFQKNEIHDTIAALNPNYFLDGRTSQRYFSLNYIFRSDHRDIRAYPLNGSFFEIEAQKLGLNIFDDINQFEATASYARYFDLNNDFYLASSFTGSTSVPRRQPYINFQGLGYSREFLRGYELYVIEGQSFAYNKTTFKRLLISGESNISSVMPLEQFQTIPFKIYLKAYFDSGIVGNNIFYPDNTRLTNEFIYGGGVGLDIVTFYDFVFRIEYSINKEGEKGFFFHFKSDI